MRFAPFSVESETSDPQPSTVDQGNGEFTGEEGEGVLHSFDEGNDGEGLGCRV